MSSPTLGTAATRPVVSLPRPALPSPASGSPCPARRPVVAFGAATGRSKAQRWLDGSPSSTQSGVSPISFKDALLKRASQVTSPASSLETTSPHVVKASSLEASPPQIMLAPALEAPSARVVLHPTDPRLRCGPDAEDWWTTESRRTRRTHLRVAQPPRRPVPVDLRGRCFNCFSSEHRAAGCRLAPYCFHCWAIGHRSYVCRRRPSAPCLESSLELRRVWRPVRSFMATPPPPVSSMVTIQNATTGVGAPGRQRRSRSRGQRADAGVEQPSSNVPGTSPDEMVAGDAPLSASSDKERAPVVRPRRIINRSTTMVQREKELSHTLVVSVFGNSLDESPESVKATIAQRFGLEEDEIVIRRFGAASCLIALPDAVTATRVYNEGRPIMSHTHRLHIMPWSRFLHSTAVALPFPVEVKLRGIPAHAWDLVTAEQLLNEFCLVSGLHPDTADRRDVFRLTAWCSSPSRMPTGMDLELTIVPRGLSPLNRKGE
ncbi:hypothetical protein SEVIR_1G121200v4 [Setaria viridis]|nr:hypothetical protein SEVIR_1G121200v2 [Setaria viridis]